MFKRLIVFITGITLVIVGCKKPLEGWNKHVHDEDVLKAQNTINESLLSKHIATLASDEFEGRFPGTTGEDKTVEYLTETYKKPHKSFPILYRMDLSFEVELGEPINCKVIRIETIYIGEP